MVWKLKLDFLYALHCISPPLLPASSIEKKKGGRDEFVCPGTHWLPELLLGTRVVGVELLIRQREGAITWPAYLRRRNRAFPGERARRSQTVLGCLASLVCTQSAADYGPLLAARVFSQSRLICTDFSGELREFWGVALKEELKISNHLVWVSSGRQDVFVLAQKTRRLQVIFVMSGEWGLFYEASVSRLQSRGLIKTCRCAQTHKKIN